MAWICGFVTNEQGKKKIKMKGEEVTKKEAGSEEEAVGARFGHTLQRKLILRIRNVSYEQ